MMMSSRFCSCLGSLALLICLSGCGGSSGPDRYQVSGEVKVDSEPMETGTISFVPDLKDSSVDPRNAPSAFGTIKNGKFTIHHSTGAIAGKHQVEIALTKVTSSGDSSEEGEEEFDEEVIALYSCQADVTANGDNTFTFDIAKDDFIDPEADE